MIARQQSTKSVTIPTGWRVSYVRQLFDLMRDGKWRTVPEIITAIGGTRNSVTSRMVAIQKEYGDHRWESRTSPSGLKEYKLIIDGPPPPYRLMPIKPVATSPILTKPKKKIQQTETVEFDGQTTYRFGACSEDRQVIVAHVGLTKEEQKALFDAIKHFRQSVPNAPGVILAPLKNNQT